MLSIIGRDHALMTTNVLEVIKARIYVVHIRRVALSAAALVDVECGASGEFGVEC